MHGASLVSILTTSSSCYDGFAIDVTEDQLLNCDPDVPLAIAFCLLRAFVGLCILANLYVVCFLIVQRSLGRILDSVFLGCITYAPDCIACVQTAAGETTILPVTLSSCKTSPSRLTGRLPLS